MLFIDLYFPCWLYDDSVEYKDLGHNDFTWELQKETPFGGILTQLTDDGNAGPHHWVTLLQTVATDGDQGVGDGVREKQGVHGDHLWKRDLGGGAGWGWKVVVMIEHLAVNSIPSDWLVSFQGYMCMCGHAQTISNSEAHMQMAKLAALQCSQRPALIGTCSAATGGEACHCKNSAVPKQDYHRIQTLSQALHKCSVFKKERIIFTGQTEEQECGALPFWPAAELGFVPLHCSALYQCTWRVFV